MTDADSVEAPRMARPSLRELEVLHAVVVTRKTTAAAQRLGISQPAVSRAIAALEARLGRALFLRDGGRLVPTADAFALDAEAAPVIASLARLENWPHAVHADSLLRIAAPPTIAHHFLAVLIGRFREIERDIRVQVEIARGADVVAAVADGTADLGVVDTPTSHPGVHVEPFRRSVAHCVLWQGHPLCGREVITPADLADVPLVTVTRRFSSRAQLDRAFADAGLEPNIVLEATTSAFVVALVRARVGVTIVNPFPLAFSEATDLAFRPFAPAIPFETSFIMPLAGAGLPIARRFADFLRAEQAEDALTVAIR